MVLTKNETNNKKNKQSKNGTAEGNKMQTSNKKYNKLKLLTREELQKKKEQEDMLVISKNGLFLNKGEFRKYQDQKEAVKRAVKNNGLSLCFASQNLKGDKDIVLEAVKRTGIAIMFASDELKKDEEVIDAALKENQLAIMYVNEATYKNEIFMKKLIEKYDDIMKYDRITNQLSEDVIEYARVKEFEKKINGTSKV